MRLRFKLPGDRVCIAAAGFNFSGLHASVRTFLEIETFGVTNRVLDKDGKILGFALFADVDGVPPVRVESELVAMRDEGWEFGDAYVFESSPGSSHVLCPVVAQDFEVAAFVTRLKRVSGKHGHSLDLFTANDEMTLRHVPRGDDPAPVFRSLVIGYWGGAWSASHLAFLEGHYGVLTARPCGESIGEGAVVKNYWTQRRK